MNEDDLIEVLLLYIFQGYMRIDVKPWPPMCWYFK